MATRAQPIGLYGWIQSNDGRSTGLFVAFLAAIQIFAPLVLFVPLLLADADHAPFFAWRGYLLRYAPIVLVASILWFAAQWWWYLETVKRAVGFAFVDDTDEPRVCRIIEPLIMLTGLPVPFVGVVETDARNAFACGIGRKKAVVVVTRGLIEALDDEELASVLAHELSHIRNGDIRLMAAANIFMGALTKLHARNALRFTWVHALLSFAVPAVLPLSLVGGIVGRWALKAGQVSRLLIASSREFIADAEAVQWTRNPAALAAALLKVDGRHRIEHTRAEDDAMMIAGDSDGPGATHPTVAQRVAALARVTGSMVFNAPSAPRAGDWTRDTTPDAVARVTFGRRTEAAQAIARVRQGDDEDMLGLDLFGRCALVAAVLGLIGLHFTDLDKPRALAAAFDPRPITLMIGTPVACMLRPFAPSLSQSCARNAGHGAYAAFEGQHNTLAGYLADISRQRHARGIINGDVTLTSFGDSRVRAPWHGESGRVQGVYAVRDEDGLYVDPDGGFMHRTPDMLIAAEIGQVGCFPTGELRLHSNQVFSDREKIGAYTITDVVTAVDESALDITVSSASPKAYVDYLERRRTLVELAFDEFGASGLATVQAAFGQKMHVDAITRLNAMLPAVEAVPGLSVMDKAGLRTLAHNPTRFVPCRSLAIVS